MRISGYDFGFSQQDGDRAASFRARHSIGQKVKGRIVRRDASGLFWVNIGGDELLARLEVQANPGDEMFFIVRALMPEIMLQALPQGCSASDLPGLVQRFRAAREVFELSDHALLNPIAALPPQLSPRREAFLRMLAVNAKTAERHSNVQTILTQINASVPEENSAHGLYLPWLLPGLRRQEMIRTARADGSVESALSAQSADCGAIETRLILGSAQAKLRLSAEQPDKSGPLAVELVAMARDHLTLEPELLGVQKLRAVPNGGVLAELFGAVPVWSSGGLNTRV